VRLGGEKRAMAWESVACETWHRTEHQRKQHDTRDATGAIAPPKARPRAAREGGREEDSWPVPQVDLVRDAAHVDHRRTAARLQYTQCTVHTAHTVHTPQ
jgi:hypothetical protein